MTLAARNLPADMAKLGRRPAPDCHAETVPQRYPKGNRAKHCFSSGFINPGVPAQMLMHWLGPADSNPETAAPEGR